MKGFFRSSGWVLIGILAMLSSLAMQIVMGVVAMLPASFMVGIQIGIEGNTDPAYVQELLMAPETLANMAVIGVLLYHVVALPVYWLWYYFGCGRPKLKAGFARTGLKGALVSVIFGAGLLFIADGLVYFFLVLTPSIYEQYAQLMETAGFGENIFAIIASVLFAPIGEELLCRGIIFHYAQKATDRMRDRKWAFWIANAIQALTFGILHMNLIQGTYAFLLGMGLGWLRKRYNSLLPAMLAHFAVNALSTFVMGYFLMLLPENLTAGFINVAIGAVIALGAVVLSRDKKEVS